MEIGFVEKMNKAEASKRLFNEMVSLLGEEETKDVSAATLLKDLYDCNHCVRYIAQMYSKGIIPSSENDDCVFGLMDSVTEEQFTEWRERLYNKELRMVPEPVCYKGIKYARLSDLIQIFIGTSCENKRINREIILVNMGEKEISINGIRVLKCSLQDIKLNPYCLSPEMNLPIYLTCDFGVKSQLASSLLSKAGYTNVTIALP